jgi:PST family polysaccharide transporter
MVPAAVTLSALSHPLIVLLLGPSWAPAAAPLRVLAFAALLRSIIEVAPPVFRALGHTRADFMLKVLQVAVMCLVLYPSAKYFGLTGVSWAVLIGALTALPMWFFLLRRTASLTAGDFLRPIGTPLVAGGACYGFLRFAPEASMGWSGLLGWGFATLVVYVAFTAVLYRLFPRAGLGAVIHDVGQ